jgi:S1-C subfamily serine protease
MKRSLLTIIMLLLLATLACGSLSTTPPTSEPTATAAAVLATATPQAERESNVIPVAQVATAAPLAESADLQETLVNLYQQVNPAVVYILVPLGSGSGFVYSEDGYIVTNNHVVAGSNQFEIVFANGERRTARLVGSDVDSDLAVLQVNDLPDGVRPLPLAAADNIQVGQFVIAIGNPFGEQGSMSLGIVSGLGRSLVSQRGLENGSSYSLPDVIQTDAPINPGNSGGPLLNLAGEVVGVNSAIASTTGTNSGVGFSIPVSALHRIIPGLIAEGEYHYPYIGAGFDDEISLAEESAFGLSQTQGAYVLNVVVGGPADDAGLIAANPSNGRGGDLITAIDGQAIDSFADLNSYLVFHSVVGQTIDLTVQRGGEEISVPLTLGERP